MSHPPSQPRPGIGEWPVWGDEPPELRFRQIPSAPVTRTWGRVPPWTGTRPAPPRVGLTGFVLGLVGACLSWVPLAGLACALVGAVLSLQALRATPAGYPGRTLPTTGLVLGCIGMVFGVSTSAILATLALNALFTAIYGA